MDSDQFQAFGRAALDLAVNYTENIRDRDVLPAVEPGYLHHMLPEEMPKEGEDWRGIIDDIHRVILPGITHWQSPQFHAYYPTSTSYPSIVGEILSASIGVIGFSWITSPACTELEVVVMDWLGKAIGLPPQFLNCADGPGGGVIQGSASEATFLCLLAAKDRAVRKVQKEHPTWDTDFIKSKMVCYTSDQANSSVEKASILSSVPIRLLPADEEGQLTGETVRNQILKDIALGNIPIFVCATLGTTPTCAFDKLGEIGPICHEFGVWLHVDAAYAGAACVCPEFRYMLQDIESADSFNFNPHKMLLTNFDCSALWVQDAGWLIDAFNVDRIYLKHHKQGNTHAPDYRHWQIPLGRRFRALKLWIVLRCYGEVGLQNHIRNYVQLAQEFEDLVRSDSRFEIVTKASLGLVCFRIRGSCEFNKTLLEKLTAERKVYMIAGHFRGKYCIRFVVCGRLTQSCDIQFAWKQILKQANQLSPTAEIFPTICKELENAD